MMARPFWLLLFPIAITALLYQNCAPSGLDTTSGTATGSLSQGSLANDGAASTSCQPVVKTTYQIQNEIVLSCQSNPAQFETVFQKTIQATGKALVRSRLLVKGTGPSANKVHGYRARVEVGSATFYQSGEDLCTGDQLPRQWFGIGPVTGSTTIKVLAQMYRDAACENGAVTIAAGSEIDVWIGDASPACASESVFLQSYTGGLLGIGTSATPILTTSKSFAAGKLTLMGQAQLDPHKTDNTCGGDRSEIAFAYLSHQGVLQSQVSQSLPPSGGMTHVLLSNEYVVANSPAGTVQIGLFAAMNNTSRAAVLPLQQATSNPVTYVGTFIGYPSSGTSLIAGVLEKPPAPPGPAITPGSGSCLTQNCFWQTTENAVQSCQYPNEAPSGSQVSGSCSDQGASNTYYWAPGSTDGCAAGTMGRYKVVQRCLTPPAVVCGQNGVTCQWQNISDAAIACQYMHQAGSGTIQAGSCTSLGQTSAYEWGTGIQGSCTAPTFLRNKVIQRCVRTN